MKKDLINVQCPYCLCTHNRVVVSEDDGFVWTSRNVEDPQLEINKDNVSAQGFEWKEDLEMGSTVIK